ncbi:hypothetical protein XacyCFBP1159_22365 [Xanthomonas arboricola pv. corylina]|nr:hypothetical protein XacyCFBP2565_22605 [Xanthomonas arboricola pv. corylina]PPU50093.1 hypothetical protein XacyCFBP1159_22365 [Xanthomonas arboricola pv. corylina]
MTHQVLDLAGRNVGKPQIRDGLLAESIDCPKQGIIPHDMVHYAVESTLHKRGFICRVIRPGFPRHLMAMENGRFGGVYEQQAVYG